jgi:hypothetical protein
MFDEKRCRGFPVCPGDTDHPELTRRLSIKRCGQSGQSGSGVINHHARDAAGHYLFLANDCYRTPINRFRDKIVSVDALAAYRHKQAPGARSPRIVTNAGHLLVQ